MAGKRAAAAGADLSVADNGTFTVTLSFVDADGVPTTAPAGVQATYAASDVTPGPSVLVLTPSADTLSCKGSVVQTGLPSPLPTGLTVSATIATGLAGQTAPMTVVAQPPIDIVPGPASSFVAADATP